MKKVSVGKVFFLFFLLLLAACSNSDHKKETILPPEDLYGQLFVDVQSNEKKILGDSKTFVDCVPKYEIDRILKNYATLRNKSDSIVISQFIENNFILPKSDFNFKRDTFPLNLHITKLWSHLKRMPDKVSPGTLIPLKHPYIVPGGRFREIYYWDSYFTMLGLQTDHQIDIIQDMVDNFSDLIHTYGFIPNGNRTYYLSRSQPPFYSLMVNLLAESKGDGIYTRYLKSLEKEYAFWMNGMDKLDFINSSCRRVVKLKDGEILNRYWDDKNTPRAESYREDMKTAWEAKTWDLNCNEQEVFRNIRAAAESGWDFSSRWLSITDKKTYALYTIHTTDIIPVDLNSLLYNLEYTISKTYGLLKNGPKEEEYRNKYVARKKALLKYCWNREKGFFMDYNFRQEQQTNIFSLAGTYPLFLNLADKEQASRVAEMIQHSFLMDGGVVTTLNNTGQQWDAPNAWAPLQWITIKGLKNYGYLNLANNIRDRWLHLNKNVYQHTFKMLEKYNVVDTTLKGGGGEYPNQDGFGWTNGVYQKLSDEK